MAMAAIAVATAAVSAFAQIRAGQAQKAMYQSQARQAEIQGRARALQARQGALQHKIRGNKILEQTSRNLSTINARAAAGAIDPWGGSLGALQTANLRAATEELVFAQEGEQLALHNAAIERGSAQFQQRIYNAAGKTAMQQAYLGAAVTMGSAFAQQQNIGGPPAAPSNNLWRQIYSYPTTWR